MKTNLIIALLFSFSVTAFCQTEEIQSHKTTLDGLSDVSATANSFGPMTYDEFKDAGIVSNDKLDLFEAIGTNKVSQCSKAPKNGACFIATTTKYSTCEVFENKVQQGHIDFKSMSYGGCTKTAHGVDISVVEEKPQPVKAQQVKQ